MACQLQKPTCKRIIMMSNKPFEKKECPLDIKPKCALMPPTCPILPQEKAKCGYAKLMGIDLDVSECPCKTCFCNEGCPFSFNNGTNSTSNWPDKKQSLPTSTPTPKEMTEQQGMEQLGKQSSLKRICEKNTSGKLCLDKGTSEQTHPEYKAILRKNIQDTRKCAMRSPRPMPCSECILKDLNRDCEGGPTKTCPYLVLPDICDKNCFCPEVPAIEIGPPCPFSPKPCPCCATPRCPVSRMPDCLLNPKPTCCQKQPKSPSNTCCMAGCSCGPCFVCLSPCKVSCICPSPCCSVKCPPCTNPPACPFVNSSPSPSCSVTNKPCPLIQPCCTSPSCIPCLLKTVECILNPCPLSSICPPIPPPCSLQKEASPTDSTVPDKEKEDRTFHLPTCPMYEPPCELHSSLNDQQDICPFSPNPCPISEICPFPVKVKSLEKKNEADADKDNPSDEPKEKPVKLISFSKDNQNEIYMMEGRNSIPSSKQCPYSSKCGVVPLPECPAAEILCPQFFKKPEKVEKKPCPFKDCMKKEGCPLGNLMPDCDCPEAKCPLKDEPECPMRELAERCPLTNKSSCLCPCPISSFCCGVSPPTDVIKLTTECPHTNQDGCHSAQYDSLNEHKKPLSKLTLTSDNVLSYCTTDATVLQSNNQHDLKKIASVKNIRPQANPSSSPSKCNLTKLDGCCCSPNDREKLNNFSSRSECPFEPLAPKTTCPLCPPKCPLTPKPNTCPLTRKPEPCPLSRRGEVICPVRSPPCETFPTGRCPMENINICECDYPCSPCLLPLQDPNVKAPPQYCFREDCCMGLPYPPVINKTTEGGIEKGPFYQFKQIKPGKEETKYYIEVLSHPPDGEIALYGAPRSRLHDNWTIVKHGEGYRRCNTIAQKLEEMGPTKEINTQYQAEDCPIDEETLLILENKKKQEKEIEQLKVNLGFGKTEEKNKRNKKKRKTSKRKKSTSLTSNTL